MIALKPRFDYRFGVWRCWLRGTRAAGFGFTPKEAWDEFMKDARERLGALVAEQMGS